MNKLEENIMNFQNEINNDIKFLAQSEIRLKILDELAQTPDNIRGLVKRTEITYSSVSSNLIKLENHNHIQKIDDRYYINPITEIYYTTLREFQKSVELINDFDTFWTKHNIDQLSVESIKRLTDLKKEKQNKAEKIENWIDYLLKAFQIEKMETDLNKLSFRKSESVSIFDEEAIPSEYKKEVVSVSIDKTEIKKAIKE